MAGWENAFGEIATAAKQDAQQTTLGAIQVAADSLLIAANAIKVAAEALNTKTTTVNTDAIAGTVALDAPTLAALETTGVAVSNFPATQPISGTVALDAPTLAALETTGVAVSNFPATQPITAASLPLPTDAATETTLAAVNAKLPDLDSGRVPVVLPPGSSGLTDFELRAQALAVAAPAGASPLADNDKLMALLEGLAYLVRTLEHVNGANGAWAATGPAQRVSLNAAQPLGAVAQVTLVPTVSSLSNQVADGGVPTNNNVYNVALANERALMARI